MTKYVLALGLALLCAGCVTAIKHGNIISVTERGFGVKVTATSTTTQTPEIWVGYFSSTFRMIPTSTNSIYSPNFADTIEIGQSAIPFSLDIQESTGSGSYQTAHKTNVTSQPIVPK